MSLGDLIVTLLQRHLAVWGEYQFLIGSIGGKEIWSYANIRPNAYSFWWLYYTDISEDYASHPLIIWLQGGPGVSGVGVGNFIEIGPLDLNLKPRMETWLTRGNLLFIDSPVGAGYSYVTDKSAFAKTNKEVAVDLVATLSHVLQNVTEFQTTPLYIFSQSYGGKLAIDFAVELAKAIKAKDIVCNFKGVALGSPWISPYDSIATWGPYLFAASYLDNTEAENLNRYVAEVKKCLSSKQYKRATELFFEMEAAINNYTNFVDSYNILRNTGPASETECTTFDRDESKLPNLMNGEVRQKLGIIPENVTWMRFTKDVFYALYEDFMKPVVDSVDSFLINEKDINLTVYTAQLDLVVDTLGTLDWIKKLKWPGLKGYQKTPKVPITFNQNRTAGFVKSFQQFNLYWMLKAGHMLPADAPESSLRMLDMILSKK